MSAVIAGKDEVRRRAKLVSNIFHPWSVLVPVLGLAAYQSVSKPPEYIKWTLLAYVPAIVFPSLYAKIRATMWSQGGNRQKISRSLFRDKPREILITTFLFGIPAALILHYLNAPRNLLIIILGVTAVMLVVTLVNLRYRASFHLAMVTSMLTALWFLFGAVSLVSFLLIPILGLSRYQLGEHTPAQTVAGFLIGLAVGGAVFYGMGLAA
jgi:membrane-associated phospholipid phosphatase